MDVIAEIGRNPISKHQIQPEYGLTNPYRETKSPRADGNRGNIILLVQLTTSRIGNHTRLIHTLLKVLTIQSQNTRILSYFALNGETLDIWPLLEIPKKMGTTQYLNFAQFHLKLCDINHIIRNSFQINGLNDL